MMRKLTKTIAGLLVLAAVLFAGALPAFAEGSVTYDGSAREFIFAPGSAYSPTDLFTDFKGLMPGDRVSQTITVKNEASKDLKVRIYLRSTGAQPGSEALLSRLHLTVARAGDSDAPYLFDAAADQTDGLTDWVLLGTLYSGGQVNLELTLEIPASLGNEFQDAVGYLDWQFRVEELPVEPEDPKPPQTGDTAPLFFYIALAGAGILGLTALLLIRRRAGKKEG